MDLIFFKNIYLEIIFLRCFDLHNIFFPFIYSINFICIFIYFIFLLILIHKFSRHNQINILIYTHLLIFPISFLVIINDFLFIYLYK